jgi:hypothetical protein
LMKYQQNRQSLADRRLNPHFIPRSLNCALVRPHLRANVSPSAKMSTALLGRVANQRKKIEC